MGLIAVGHSASSTVVPSPTRMRSRMCFIGHLTDTTPRPLSGRREIQILFFTPRQIEGGIPQGLQPPGARTIANGESDYRQIARPDRGRGSCVVGRNPPPTEIA